MNRCLTGPLRRLAWRGCAFGLALAIAACGRDAVAPSRPVPARLDPVSAVLASAMVGSAVPGGLVVRVTDASGNPVPNQAVGFAVTAGNGETNPRIVVTNESGQAATAWTLGTIVGPNQVTVSVSGVEAPLRFDATGSSGPPIAIEMGPLTTRLQTDMDSTRITVQSLDRFGNQTSPGPMIIVRDSSLVSVDSSGVVRVIRRGGSTFVVAIAGELRDSVLVTVLASGESICSGIGPALDLAVGQVVTGVSGDGVCVHGSAPDAEYALMPFLDSGISGASIRIEVRGDGLASFGPLADVAGESIVARALRAPAATAQRQAPGPVRDVEFERQLRQRERDQGTPRIEGARAAWRRRHPMPRAGRAAAPTAAAAAAAAAAVAVPAIGDIVQLNVNPLSYCSQPDVRTGRVAAVTDRAIVVADTANPAGGFTETEYRSFGVTFDTLIDPVDREAFGAPSDIDENGRVVIFFTRAVNELTPSGASSLVLGYFYSRDLLPKAPSTGPVCPGSNEAEVMYLLVPDTGGVINGNHRSKVQVLNYANGTVAHEYQHMINAGRRLYVNGAGGTFEDAWLDEGLAHVAEELNFWRASGLSPRSNLGAGVFDDPRAVAAYSTFEAQNFLRYQTYLPRTETQSPIGSDDFDNDLQTRGAIWNFLRYAADHRSGPENDFWFALVNSKTTGLANLSAALGASPDEMLRDWAISVFLDDAASSVDPRFQQPSWNLRSALTRGGQASGFSLRTHVLADGARSIVTLGEKGIAFFQFSVPAGQDALLTTTTRGERIPPTVRLAVVRIR